MEASSLRFLLKSLCDCSYWDYAMFWKLHHHVPQTLTWLDGYYNDSKTKQKMSEDVDFGGKDRMPSSGRNGLPVLLTAMSNLQFPLGEGVVGKVASSGDHCSVFCDNIFEWEFNSSITSECPNEWLYQFTLGIKTVVLIPVMPHGVLQLGSYEVVSENMAMVASAKRWLNVIYCTSVNGGTLSLDNSSTEAESFPCLTHPLLDVMDGTSFATVNPPRDDQTDFTPSTNRSRSFYQTLSSVDEASTQMSEDFHEFLRSTDMEDIDFLPNWIYETQESDDVLNACFESVNNVGAFTDLFDGMNFDFTKSTEEEQSRNTDMEDKGHRHVNVDFLKLSADYELREALRLVGDGQTDQHSTDSFFVDDGHSNSKLNSNEYLLHAIVGNLSGSDDNLSCIANNTWSFGRASEQSTATQQQIHAEETKLTGENDGSEIETKSNDTSGILRVPACTESISCVTADQQQQEQTNDLTHNQSEPKSSNSSRKRTRSRNCQRPRPRDRQLIQDRVKELRELVPDGTNCSIDGLLDRTIRHMLHLRNVTKQEDKLRRFVRPEVLESKRSNTKKDKHSGKSYAFEFGTEHQICPIIIEDLECTGNMRIEMVCDEHGMFLEIAQTIRRLELMILKGVLENNENTKWARFIVEVPGTFNRMEIFWPLMHLLQLRRKSISSRT